MQKVLQPKVNPSMNNSSKVEAVKWQVARNVEMWRSGFEGTMQTRYGDISHDICMQIPPIVHVALKLHHVSEAVSVEYSSTLSYIVASFSHISASDHDHIDSSFRPKTKLKSKQRVISLSTSCAVSFSFSFFCFWPLTTDIDQWMQ